MMDEDVVAQVQEDVERGIGEIFTGGRGFRTTGVSESGAELWDEARESAAVPWVWHGFHEATVLGSNEFSGLAPTGAEVEIHGITLVYDDGEGRRLFRRYIDWLGSLAPLGLGLTTRPIIHSAEAGWSH